jgi:hypothetical protein
MQKTFICQGCGKQKPTNPRLKGNQRFCGELRCQRIRKARWQKTKMQTDPVYRSQQHDCLQKWRKERPLHRYQHEYRAAHPGYVAENRRKQKIRNRKRLGGQTEAEMMEMIVKMDALSQIKSATYVMTPLATEKIVKMDALVVELTVLKELSGDFTARPP